VSTYDFVSVQADHTIDASFALTNVTVSLQPEVLATYAQTISVPVELDAADGIMAQSGFPNAGM